MYVLVAACCCHGSVWLCTGCQLVEGPTFWEQISSTVTR